VRGKRQAVRGGSDRELYEWIQALVCSVLAVIVIFTFAARLMRVDGPSMRETLQSGDLILVENAALAGSPRCGEVVVVRTPGFNEGRPIVKRVVALAGQTVDIDYAAGTVSVDGTVLDEPYIREATRLDEGTAFPLTVPEGCVFVMGDNRGDSDDSRDPALGPVDTRSIVGRAVLVAVPGLTADTGKRDFSRIGAID